MPGLQLCTHQVAARSLILNKFILYVLTGGETSRFRNTVFMSRVDLAPGKLGTALLGQHRVTGQVHSKRVGGRKVLGKESSWR